MTPETEAAPISGNAATFDAWFARFLATTLEHRPVDATLFGAHQYDHRLPDVSREADAAWTAQASALIRDLDAIPADGLSEARFYDRILARSALQLWIEEARAPWSRAGNPAHHTSEAIASVLALVHATDGGDDARVEATIARLRAIPEFLATARRRVRAAPLSWTELAIRQSEAAARSFGAWPAQDYGSDRPEFRRAAIEAAAAFETHTGWLRAELAEHRIAVQPAGTDTLDRYLHLGHLLPAAQTPAWWFDYAHAELIEATADLRALAHAIDWRVSARVQLQRLAHAHPTAETYDATFPLVWERCRAVAEQAGLVTWPELPVRFRALAPPALDLWQAISASPYRAAPPLAPNTGAQLFYPALDPTWPEDRQQQTVRQMNDTQIVLDAVVRNAGLGRHVQSAYARTALTRIGQLAGISGATGRLFFCGNAISDGWASYAAELMEEVGALTPLQRLAEAHRRLRVAAHAVADIGLHTGELSMVRVARMYRDEAGMTSTQAMAQAVHDSMHPGAGMAELAGTAGIDELRRAIEDREGAAFDLKAFHDRFLGYGAIPVTLIAASMLDAPGA